VKTIAVIGWKNSGKTTIVSQLVTMLKSKNLKVGVVKHAHHSFDIDKPNTDSFKIRQAGSDKITVVSDKRLAFIEEKKNPEISFDQLIELNKDCDILIFEGFKSNKDLPKIEVYLSKNNKEYLYKSIDNVKFLITDDKNDHPIKKFYHDQLELLVKEILNEL
jgi:molybdopterin-guanine dinucleotide biosynthesis protein MobB